MECVVCGGTNFTKESGLYFCQECQTQSQEVKEHAFQEENTYLNVKETKKIKDNKPKISGHVTSWECYNVILASLTDELIQLGADAAIKKIVKCLWMRYLEKLEVLKLDQDQIPKLSVVNIKRDVNITYGVKKKKRKRKSSSESSITESISRRERSKKKTALAQSQYSELSSKKDSSLHNETLTSLKTPSENSDCCEIKFNKYGTRELKKCMTRKHLANHRKDLETNLNCHKFTHKARTMKYRKDVYFISPIKIYSILYISLLIKKDPIQLGDLFRFLREGHLNYNRLTSLFPETYSNKTLNIQNHSKQTIFSHRDFRATVAKLVEFLEVRSYIKHPNIIELAQRYCQELNLPDEIFDIFKNILSRNPMTFGKLERKSIIPNYEGRVMSLIIFTLKLLFGLDGETEKELSKLAQILNGEFPNLKMFNIHKWMEVAKYRNLVVSEKHFPSYHLNNADINTDLFLQHKMSHNILADDKSRLVSDMVGYKNLLSKIIDLQSHYINPIEYSASLTPYRHYLQVIKENCVSKENFQSDTLDFLLNPFKYLLEIDRNFVFKHGGANDNWILEKMKTYHQSVYHLNERDKKFVTTEIIQNNKIRNANQPTFVSRSRTVSDIQRDFEKYHASQFTQNKNVLTNLYHKSSKNVSVPDNDSSYKIHCNPYERHWMFLRGRLDLTSKEKYNDHFNKYTDSFKLVLSECARIIEQSCQELSVEFQNTELYLVYCGDYPDSIKRRRFSNLEAYIKPVESCW